MDKKYELKQIIRVIVGLFIMLLLYDEQFYLNWRFHNFLVQKI